MRTTKLFLKAFTVIAASVILFASCNKDEENIQDPTLPAAKTEGKVQLGKKLDNAYSVTNMQNAYQKLRERGEITEDITISETHTYIKITSIDSAGLDLLLNDTNIELFNYPLDYELIGTGVYEPTNDSSILYTVIPAGYNLGSHIQYQVLEHCYIPDDKASIAEQMIEEESLRLTGNLSDEPESKAGSIPQGYIKVYNTNSETYIPVMKVKVRTNTLVNIRTAYTDENGFYKMGGKFVCKPNYTIVYENQIGFKIWGNLAFLAPTYLYLGTQSQTGFSKNITTSSAGWSWSTINNATYIYYQQICPHFTINKPCDNLRIWATRSGNWGGSAPMLHYMTLTPSFVMSLIAIYRINEMAGIAASALAALVHIAMPDVFILQDYGNTDKMYKLLFHELSHASHFSKVGSGYWNTYIGQIIVNGGYGDTGNSYNGVIGVGEMWANYFEDIAFAYYKGNTEVWCSHYDNDDDGIDEYEWFAPCLLHEVSSEVPGMTPNMYFYCLTSNTYNQVAYKNSLIATYGIINGIDYSSTIEEIFENNGF
ncbi:MAG: hypothetical protein MJZ45_00115 [Bacteroidales bacterium]|nr:hypothetical protein [Bacteroidales bacterium]